MNFERDFFRIDLRSAKLCMELDCNTIFDATRYRDCPTCGSVEFYPLETWLNRDVARAVWLGHVRGAHPESEVPVRLRARAAQLRRAG